MNGSPGPGSSQPASGRGRATAARSPSRAGKNSERRNSARGSAWGTAAGERPPALWHPWPLSELLILVGAVGVVVGMVRLGHGGFANGGAVLFAGLGAVALGTFEVTLREHRAGYRSHTLMLAFLPVLVFHTVIVLGTSALVTLPGNAARWLNIGVFVPDLALFAVLFKLLRTSFRDARARRPISGR